MRAENQPKGGAVNDARWGLSNSRECLAALRDKRIVGYMENALPLNDATLSRGNKTLVFDDGTGFTFSAGGSFWHESAEDVTTAIHRLRRHLEDTGAALESLLAMAGEQP